MKRPTLIVIDDETEILKLIDEVFDEESIILTSNTPVEFLRYVESMRHNRPLLCLIDLQIKAEDGTVTYGNVLAEQAKQIAPSAKIQLMSGIPLQDADIITVGGYEIPAKDILQKPFDIVQLKRRVEELLKSP